jgi:hypothetical protein
MAQAEKTTVAAKIAFWGCPVMNFRASLPFHGMRRDFAASERDPNGPPIPLRSSFNALN